MIIIDKKEIKYKEGIEDGFISDKPFIYSIEGNLILHPDDIIGITDDGSKYIKDADASVLKFRETLYNYYKSLE